MSADRDSNINVVTDDNGLVALNPGVDSDVVRLSDNPGELLIDFTADGNAGGVNTNSQYQVGYFRQSNKGFVPEGLNDQIDDPSVSAFEIQNNDTIPHSFDATFECDQSDIGNAELTWQFFLKTRVHMLTGITGSNTTQSILPANEIPQVNQADSRWLPGDTIQATLHVDTRGVTEDPEDLDLSGTLSIDVGQDPYHS
jgi:hypothetical protein